jgi:hypothetical protein
MRQYWIHWYRHISKVHRRLQPQLFETQVGWIQCREKPVVIAPAHLKMLCLLCHFIISQTPRRLTSKSHLCGTRKQIGVLVMVSRVSQFRLSTRTLQFRGKTIAFFVSMW